MEDFFYWAAESPLGSTMRNSRYLYPAVETLHLIGLAVLLGSMIIFNLRHFGLGMQRQTIGEIKTAFAPWTLASIVLMAVSGIPMFASRAPDLYDFKLTDYLLKMGMVAVAIAIHYIVQRPLAKPGSENALLTRALAGFMLLLWFATAYQGLILEFF